MGTVGAPVDLGTAVQAPDFSSDDEIRRALQPPLRYPPRGPVLPPRGAVLSPDFPDEDELQSSSQLVPQTITADDFVENSGGYAMKFSTFQLYKPFLSSLSPKQAPVEPQQKKEKKEEEEKPVERFEHIKDEKFLEEVNKVLLAFKGKEGSGKKRDAVKSAAKEFWNSNLGKRIDYRDLKAILETAAGSS